MTNRPAFYDRRPKNKLVNTEKVSDDSGPGSDMSDFLADSDSDSDEEEDEDKDKDKDKQRQTQRGAPKIYQITCAYPYPLFLSLERSETLGILGGARLSA